MKITPYSTSPDLTLSQTSNASQTPSILTRLYQSIVPCLEQSRSRIWPFLWSVTWISLPFSQNAEASNQTPLFYQEKEAFLELKNKEQAQRFVDLANQNIHENKDRAFSYLLQAAKFHYPLAAQTFTNWINQDFASEEDLTFFFTSIQKTLDLYRYRGPINQKEKIVELVYSIDPVMANDISFLIDQVINLLKDLKIYYHNIQHTLEVTLGITQIRIESFRNDTIKDPSKVLLPIVAALFHDIAYSNTPEMLSLVQQLSSNEYSPLFLAEKGADFVENFEELVQRIDPRRPFIGAEMHLYHVPLSQVLLPFILNRLPESFTNKQFLLRPDSLEKMQAMIALTDIKPDLNGYRENRRAFLAREGFLKEGESLMTSDLLTQLSTSDRMSKGLALYHEFFIGDDSQRWSSGLALIGSATGFYEFFAKKQFNLEALSVLDSYFASSSFNTNPYRTGVELIFFLHKLFEPIYQKLLSAETITDQEIQILEGLQQNGLQKEITGLFRAVKYTRENLPIPRGLKNSLNQILKEKNSLLEISLGDEIRLTLLRDAAINQNTEEMIRLLALRKPELLIDRFLDFISAFELLKNHLDQETLTKVALKILNKLPENTPKLLEIKNYFTLKKMN